MNWILGPQDIQITVMSANSKLKNQFAWLMEEEQTLLVGVLEGSGKTASCEGPLLGFCGGDDLLQAGVALDHCVYGLEVDSSEDTGRGLFDTNVAWDKDRLELFEGRLYLKREWTRYILCDFSKVPLNDPSLLDEIVGATAFCLSLGAGISRITDGLYSFFHPKVMVEDFSYQLEGVH